MSTYHHHTPGMIKYDMLCCVVWLDVVCVSTCYHHIYDQGWDKKMTEAGAASQHGSNTTQPTRAIRATLAGSNTTPGYPHQPTQSKVSAVWIPGYQDIHSVEYNAKYRHTEYRHQPSQSKVSSGYYPHHTMVSKLWHTSQSTLTHTSIQLVVCLTKGYINMLYTA